MGIAATSAASRSAPLVRTKVRSAAPSTEPAGSSMFCRPIDSIIACGVTPSEANRLDSNSTFTCSTWRPITSTLFTPATACSERLMSSASTCVSAGLSSGACSA
jgi:hypothetical protein